MTMFDEETLKNALAQAANEFSVSATAPDRILDPRVTVLRGQCHRRAEAHVVTCRKGSAPTPRKPLSLWSDPRS